ncbi:hypothetical protein SLA2020_063350 [Shorea laevis]
MALASACKSSALSPRNNCTATEPLAFGPASTRAARGLHHGLETGTLAPKSQPTNLLLIRIVSPPKITNCTIKGL